MTDTSNNEWNRAEAVIRPAAETTDPDTSPPREMTAADMRFGWALAALLRWFVVQVERKYGPEAVKVAGTEPSDLAEPDTAGGAA